MIDILYSIFSAIYNAVSTLVSIVTSIPSMIDKIRLMFIHLFPISYSYGNIIGSALICIMFVAILIGIKRLII